MRRRDGEWTRVDIDRLISGDKPGWERVVAMIERQSRSWRLSTIEEDAVRDYAADVLIAHDMRLLREFREPVAFPAYLARVVRSGVAHIVKARSTPGVCQLGGAAEQSAVRPIADACHPVGHSPVRDGPAQYRAALGRGILRSRHALTDRQCLILWLCHLEGHSMNRVAVALKVTRQAVAKAHEAAILAIRRRRGLRPPARVRRGASPGFVGDRTA